MAQIFVDHFVYNNGSYDCYYDTIANAGTVQYTGPGSAQSNIPIPNAGRGYTQGQYIRDFCSDNPSTTKVTCYATSASPFFTWTLEQNSASCQVQPPQPGQCDIVISSVNVTAETQSGGNDGTATVNASSSSAITGYSIDGGATFQAASLFTSLAPGNYSVIAKDANNCTTSQPFSILAYNNPVQNFTDGLPVVTIPNGNISRWNAAFNPIVFTYQRKDFTISTITQSGNQIKVQLTTALPYAQYQLALTGDVYFKSSKYDFRAQPVAYDSGSGFTFDLPYYGDDTGGFLNITLLKTNFYVQSEITASNNPQQPIVIVAENSANSKGQTKCDVAPYLQTLLSKDDLNPYINNSYRDYNLGGSFTLRYREVWDTGNSQWYSAPYPLYYTYAAMQLGEQYGGNMAQYVPFMSVSLNKYKAKFLTDFEKPTYWAGLPFDLSFIYSENVINEQLTMEIVPNCGNTENSLLLNADATYLLNADNSRFVIQRTYNENIQGYDIIEALGINRCKVPNVFDCCATELAVNIKYGSAATTSVAASINERQDPSFIDGNIDITLAGVSTSLPNGSTTLTANANSNYSFRFYVNQQPTDPNAIIVGRVSKNGTSVYQHSQQANAGTSFTYSGIIDGAGEYSIECYTTTPSGFGIPEINIPDNSGSTTGTYIMQPLPVKHVCTCDDPYVYLKWINSRGAWDYWRFGYNQAIAQTTTGSEQTDKYVNDWANDTTIEDWISRSANKKLTLVAGQLDLQELKALSWLSNSIRVQMLVNANPVKWQTVIINDGDFNAGETRKGMGNVKLQIQLPAINIQKG